MMKTLTAALFVGAMSSAAGAATFDFVAEAANNERGVVNGTTLDFGGIGTTFNATANGNDAFAYFDDLSGGLPAGLGVCAVIDSGAQCNPSDDDNLTAGENLDLSFDKVIDLSGFSFYNGKHRSPPSVAPTATLQWAINGGTLQTITFADAVATTLTGVSSIQFGHDGTDYYIAAMAAVPLPAGILLMGTALGGLGLTRRKKKAA